MPQFKATLTFLGLVTGGLYAACGAVLATAGWTAPACIASGFASGIGLILAVFTDLSGQTVTNGNNPDPTKREAPQWFKVHDDGFMELYDGRMHELHNSNETHTIHDAVHGFVHTLDTVDGYTRVYTDFSQHESTKNVRMPSSEVSAVKAGGRRRRSGMQSSVEDIANLFPRAHKHVLDGATYMAQKIGSVKHKPGPAAQHTLGQQIGNKAYRIGSYCTTFKYQSKVIADMGLTLSEKGSTPSTNEPPCRA